VDERIRENKKFLDLIVEDPEIFGHDLDEGAEEEEGEEGELFVLWLAGELCLRGRYFPGASHINDSDHDQSHSHSHSHSHGGHSHSRSHSQAQPSASSGSGGRRTRYRPTEFDMDKLRSTLKQFVRDWSEEVKSCP
jgi:carnosine N-methyltransferase